MGPVGCFVAAAGRGRLALAPYQSGSNCSVLTGSLLDVLYSKERHQPFVQTLGTGN
jgi:hypothetical protein